MISVGNWLDFRNQSSVWPNRSMIDCVIGSWDVILKISAHVIWMVGRGSDHSLPRGYRSSIAMISFLMQSNLVFFFI